MPSSTPLEPGWTAIRPKLTPSVTRQTDQLEGRWEYGTTGPDEMPTHTRTRLHDVAQIVVGACVLGFPVGASPRRSWTP